MYIPDESLPLPPKNVEAPPIVSTPPVAPKNSTFDKVVGLGKTLGSDMQHGLSYANARRARETYRG